MPIKPKSVHRPWIKQVDYNIPGQGRLHVNTFYQSSQWKRLRDMFIKGASYHLGIDKHMNTICIECWKKDRRSVPTHTIDHIKPINQANAYDTQHDRYGEPLEWTNLQPLCSHCNAVKTGKERHMELNINLIKHLNK